MQTKKRRERLNESPPKVYCTISLLYMSESFNKCFTELANLDNHSLILTSKSITMFIDYFLVQKAQSWRRIWALLQPWQPSFQTQTQRRRRQLPRRQRAVRLPLSHTHLLIYVTIKKIFVCLFRICRSWICHTWTCRGLISQSNSYRLPALSAEQLDGKTATHAWKLIS